MFKTGAAREAGRPLSYHARSGPLSPLLERLRTEVSMPRIWLAGRAQSVLPRLRPFNKPAGKPQASRVLGTLSMVSAVDLMASEANLNALRWIGKPVLAPSMIAYLLRAGRRDLVTVSLIFAWAADLAMLAPGKAGLLAGMGLFLATQLCLLSAFLRRSRPRWPVYLAGGVLWLAANALLWGRVDDLRLPILVYSLALTAMAAAATDHGPRVATGGLLFFVSDLLIGLRLAGLAAPALDLLVMATYVAALALITMGWAAGPTASGRLETRFVAGP
ncbi:lysoplasmalogenase [Actinoplanes sp. NPDC051633]|uniref:lysoplasmalogenase n=1 Tax=Actinoplanes sp. NPDC051633 TaxID=3155670 RepID=UPI00342DFACE